MRTREVQSIQRVRVTAYAPRPSICLTYDGLGGISLRPMLRDLHDELKRQGPEVWTTLLAALERAGSGLVHVYFLDYVSYGVGGGDAVAEFHFGTKRIFWVSGEKPFRGWTGPGLALVNQARFPADPRTPEDDQSEERLPFE